MGEPKAEIESPELPQPTPPAMQRRPTSGEKADRDRGIRPHCGGARSTRKSLTFLPIPRFTVHGNFEEWLHDGALAGDNQLSLHFLPALPGGEEAVAGRFSRPELSAEAEAAPCGQRIDALKALRLLFLKDHVEPSLFLHVTWPTPLEGRNNFQNLRVPKCKPHLESHVKSNKMNPFDSPLSKTARFYLFYEASSFKKGETKQLG